MQRSEPFFPIGVWCRDEPAEGVLRAIRAAGFNGVRDGLDASAGLATRAARAGLRMVVGDGCADVQVDPSATAADLRLWGWLALLRGARGVFYYAWRDLIDDTGALTPRGRAAAAFAGVVARNPALFEPLRPAGGSADRVRVEGTGEVEAGWLESRDALVLVAVNHGGAAARAVVTFARGTKQEFWQNLETGDRVTLAMRGEAPSLTHAFAARDALVLMIRKTSPYDRHEWHDLV